MMKCGRASSVGTSRMISTCFFGCPARVWSSRWELHASGGVVRRNLSCFQGCEGLGWGGRGGICAEVRSNKNIIIEPSNCNPQRPCQIVHIHSNPLKPLPLKLEQSFDGWQSGGGGRVGGLYQRFDFKLMQVEVLVQRISQTVDDLGRLLDQIYKFPQRQREQYFQKIQTLKNGLLNIKTNLKEANAVASDKQYRQIYLAANSLKSEVATQSTLCANKENRDMNRREKQGRKNHDDAMKLIVERDEHIGELKGELHQKEELIRLNYEELRQYKRENQKLESDNRYAKYQLAELQVNYAAISASYNQVEEELMDLRIQHQDLKRNYRLAAEEVEATKLELLSAYEKLEHYEQLAEISMKKTRMVEENIRKIENEARELNDNYRNKESQGLRREKEKTELEEQLARHLRIIHELQQDNQTLRKDLDTHEKEMVQLQRAVYDQRANTHEERDKYQLQISRAERERDFYRKQSEKASEELQQTERKYEEVLHRINEVEQQSDRLINQKNALEVELSHHSDRIQHLTSDLEKASRESLLLASEKQKLAEQVDKYIAFNKALEADVLKAKEKCRSKDDERIRLTKQIEETHSQLRHHERTIAQATANEQILHAQLNDLKTQLIRSDERHTHRQREMTALRTRLLHAKIQTLHQIREELA